MVRPRVARGDGQNRICGLALSGLRLERFRAPGHHGYARAAELIRAHASTGRECQQGSDAPGRPFFHLFHSLADLGGNWFNLPYSSPFYLSLSFVRPPGFLPPRPPEAVAGGSRPVGLALTTSSTTARLRHRGLA